MWELVQVLWLINYALRPSGVLFTVSRVNGATADSVTLTCDSTPDCAIMFGREIGNLSETGHGTSGVALENLVTNKIYFYEARTTDGVVNVTVTDSFGTCGECSVTKVVTPMLCSCVECSPTFFGSEEANAICQELDLSYIGGVCSVSTGESGTVCHDGTVETSVAVFECTSGGTCAGGCSAECMCAESGAAGVWSSDFASVACVTTGTCYALFCSGNVKQTIVVHIICRTQYGCYCGDCRRRHYWSSADSNCNSATSTVHCSSIFSV